MEKMRILLKFYLGLYIMSLSLLISKKNAHRYLTVSPFDVNDIPGSTLLQRSMQFAEDFPEEVDKQPIRDDICRIIAGSDFMHNTYHTVPIGPQNSKIYRNGSSVEFSSNITGPYRPLEILIGGIVSHVAVFPCKMWNHVDFVDILISRQLSHYNGSMSSRNFRLVFKENEMGKFATIAIAEDPPNMINIVVTGEVTDFFKTLGKLELDSSICILPKNMKIRLCTIILGAKEYRTELKILSSTDEPKCNRHNVRFDDITLMTDSGKVTSETCNINLWTLECQAVDHYTVGFDVPEVLYIFREINSHSYYIAREYDGIIKVKASFYV